MRDLPIAYGHSSHAKKWSNKTTTFDVTITLVEDKGTTEEPTTTAAGGYNYGGASSFEDFFRQYFGDFGF